MKRKRTLQDMPSFVIIIRSIHERGASQQAALTELARRGLWLTQEQKAQAGLVEGVTP